MSNKCITAVFLSGSHPRETSWLALHTSLQLKEITKQQVLLSDMLSTSCKTQKVLAQKNGSNFIIFNLPHHYPKAPEILKQADFIFCTDAKASLTKFQKKYSQAKIMVIDFVREKKLRRREWLTGHLARRICGRTIGLALGSGTVGGLVHIGVMRYLQEKKIPIDMISGSSGGAVYGALWIFTGDWKITLELVRKYMKKNFFGLLNFSWSLKGISDTFFMRKIFDRIFSPNFKIDQLKIPFIVTATDLIGRKSVTFTSGSLWKALRASISLPIIFTPLKIGRRLLSDGSSTNPLPVTELRKAGIDNVIAVYTPKQHATLSSLKNWMDVYLESRSMMSDTIAAEEAKKADVYINPDVSKYGLFEYDKLEKLVQLGYKKAEKKGKAISQIH